MGKHISVSRSTKKLEKEAYKAQKKEQKAEKKALVPDSVKTGNHNCPSKDAGTTHAFRARCFKQNHAGFCPACGRIYSYKHGCRDHELKQDDLLEKSPTLEALLQFCVANGVDISHLEQENEDETNTETEAEAESESEAQKQTAKGKGKSKGRGKKK